MTRIIILCIIYQLCISASCSRNKNCIEKTYLFSINIRVFPDMDSVNINDTVWLEFISPTRLTDVVSGNSINYDNAINLGTSINFYQFTGGSFSNPGAIAAVDAFEYKLVYGVFVPDDVLPNQNKDYHFIQVNSEYKFKLGIIPKRIGVFSFSPSNSGTVRRANDNFSKAGFDIIFSNTSQHLFFYEQNRPGYTPSEYERTHMYCFKVK
jgi:hypothetical protein